MKSFRHEISSLDRLDPQYKENQMEKTITVKLFGRKYDHFKPHYYKLDKKFLETAGEIEGSYKSKFYSKPDQVRVE